MKFYNTIGGSAPHYRRYKVAAAHAVGAPVIRTAAGATGVTIATTTSTANAIGVVQDNGADYNAGVNIPYSTTQGDVEAVYKVIINPDAIWRLLLNEGATDGTALTVRTVTTASSDGLVVTTGFDYSSPQMDEGTVWCTSGANVGQSRKITSTSTTAATVIMPFLNDTVVGDTFQHAPYFVGNSPFVQLTSNLLNADNSIAVGSGAGFSVLDLELNGVSDSYVLAILIDHVFGVST